MILDDGDIEQKYWFWTLLDKRMIVEEDEVADEDLAVKPV